MIKDVEGYEGYYTINTEGNIFNSKGHMMTPFKINSGYMMVTLYKDGVKKGYLVHRLVAKHFCEGYKEGLVVNHKDANRTNNKASNLEWCTNSYNMQDVIKRGTLNTESARKALVKVQRTPVLCMSSTGTLVTEYGSLKEASEDTGIPYCKISVCCSYENPKNSYGKYHMSGGYHWRYKNGIKNARHTRKIDLVKDNEIHHFSSVNKASAWLGVNSATLNNKVKQGCKEYRGYTLVY